LIITVTHCVLAYGVVCGCYAVTTDAIVYVLAVLRRVGDSRVTNFEAEHIRAHVIVPLDNLLVAVVVAAIARERI